MQRYTAPNRKGVIKASDNVVKMFKSDKGRHLVGIIFLNVSYMRLFNVVVINRIDPCHIRRTATWSAEEAWNFWSCWVSLAKVAATRTERYTSWWVAQRAHSGCFGMGPVPCMHLIVLYIYLKILYCRLTMGFRNISINYDYLITWDQPRCI